MLSCEFYEISENSFFTEDLRTTTSRSIEINLEDLLQIIIQIPCMRSFIGDKITVAIWIIHLIRLQILYAYQELRNVSLSENFANVLNE